VFIAPLPGQESASAGSLCSNTSTSTTDPGSAHAIRVAFSSTGCSIAADVAWGRDHDRQQPDEPGHEFFGSAPLSEPLGGIADAVDRNVAATARMKAGADVLIAPSRPNVDVLTACVDPHSHECRVGSSVTTTKRIASPLVDYRLAEKVSISGGGHQSSTVLSESSGFPDTADRG